MQFAEAGSIASVTRTDAGANPGQGDPYSALNKTITYTVSGLPEHVVVDVEAEALIRHNSLGWDEEAYDGDTEKLKLTVGGVTVEEEYPDDGTGNFSSYTLRARAAHTGGTVNVTFASSQWEEDHWEVVSVPDLRIYVYKPQVSLTAGQDAMEGYPGRFTFAAHRDMPPAGFEGDAVPALSVSVTPVGGTAGTDDYSMGSAARIEAGLAHGYVAGTVRNDFDIEGTETVIAAITGGGSQYTVAPGFEQATVQILDDDPRPGNIPGITRLSETDANGNGIPDNQEDDDPEDPPPPPPEETLPGGGGGGGGQEPPPPEDYINVAAGFGGTNPDTVADGPDEDSLPDPGPTWGSTSGGAGKTTGGFLALNDDFDEGNIANGLPAPDNDASFTNPGIVAGDGEVWWFSLGMWSDTYDRAGTFNVTWTSTSKVKLWVREPTNPNDPNSPRQLVEKQSGWSQQVEFINSTVIVGSGWFVSGYVEGIEASGGADDVTFTATFTPGDEHGGSDVQDKASITVADVDLEFGDLPEHQEEDPGYAIEVNNDDDDGNDLPDAEDAGTVSGEDDLVPLKLRVTPTTLDGRVTLSIAGGADKVRVWLNAQRDGGGPILGGSITEVDWNAGQQPDTVYVEAIGGSLSVGDIVFSLGYAPATTQTTRTATTDTVKATARGLAIRWMGKNKDVQGIRAGDVIVGEDVWLLAIPLGPGAGQATYQWTVGGTAVAGYNAGNAKGEVIKLEGDAVKRAGIHIFWVSGSFVGADTEVSIQETVGGQVRTQRTTFKVFRPEATIATTTFAPDIVNNEMYAQARFDRQGFNIPQGFAGDTQWVQLVTAGDMRRRLLNGNWVKHRESPGLDNDYPYPQEPAGWTSDTPRSVLNQANFNRVDRKDSFEMYLMFKPDSVSSIWVPLRVVNWGWEGSATWNGAQWNLIRGSITPNPADADTMEFPVWTHNNGDDLAAGQWDPVNGGIWP